METLAEMTAAVKNTPTLRFPEFEGEWEQTTLGEFLTFKNGVNADKEKYGSGYRFINVMDIINNNFITHDKIIGSVEISEKEFEKNEVKYGDILFQRSSETREEVGQSNVYLDRDKSATFGGFVIRGQATKEYNPMFMNYLLKTDFARKEITTKSGGSTRYNVGQETLKAVNVIIPVIPEQQKIASFLSAADEKIQQLSKKKELLERYKKGVMQQIFSQQIRFKDDNGDDFPEWEEKRLGEISRISKGKGVSKSDITEDGDLECIRYGELYTHYGEVIQEIISRTNVSINELVLSEYNDVIIPASGETQLDIAKASCVLKNGVALGGDLNIIKVKANGIFLSYYINSKLKKDIAKLAQGISVVHLYASQLQSLKLCLPCLTEQTKIANFLITIDIKTNYTSKQLEQARQFKKGLLQQLFV